MRSPARRFGRLHSCSAFPEYFSKICCSIAQGSGDAAHQAGSCNVGEDAVVVDHDRRRKHVAQMTADAEVAIVAVSRQSAGAYRAHDGCSSKLGASTLSRLIDDWKSSEESARSSCSWAA